MLCRSCVSCSLLLLCVCVLLLLLSHSVTTACAQLSPHATRASCIAVASSLCVSNYVIRSL